MGLFSKKKTENEQDSGDVFGVSYINNKANSLKNEIEKYTKNPEKLTEDKVIEIILTIEEISNVVDKIIISINNAMGINEKQKLALISSLDKPNKYIKDLNTKMTKYKEQLQEYKNINNHKKK